MKIYNQDKTKQLNENEPDLSLGKLMADKLFVAHHEAIEAAEEIFHYETVKEYPNGGKDVRRVIDVPKTEAKEAWDEYEDVYIYVPYTENELAKHNALKEISELKAKLTATDYQAIKYAEGELSAEEYAEIKAQRRACRKRINELEALL